MKTICNKLQIMYDGRVICCAQFFSHPYKQDTFNFLVGSKYSWRGYANPCAFFGKTSDLNRLFTELVAIYCRLKNNLEKTATQLEQFIINSNALESDILENVQFIWQVYQANGQYWDLQPDVDVRLFSQVGNIQAVHWERNKSEPFTPNGNFIGNSCIVHVPNDVDRDDFVQWAIDKGLMCDEVGRIDETVAMAVDTAKIRRTNRKRHNKKSNR